jgi:hypothetical protein
MIRFMVVILDEKSIFMPPSDLKTRSLALLRDKIVRHNQNMVLLNQKQIKKEAKMKNILLGILIIILTVQLGAFVCLNDVYCAFSEGVEKTQIETNVIAGAGHFLQSKASADLLLYEFEKSANQPYQIALSLEHVERAIAELTAANGNYTTAATMGKAVGYIQVKTTWFKSFNFDQFIEGNKFNKDIAAQVKNYLSKCDIVGLYEKNIDFNHDILNSLYAIRDSLKANKKPNLTIIWKLLQQYSETALFGNYATIMGSTILGNCEYD